MLLDIIIEMLLKKKKKAHYFIQLLFELQTTLFFFPSSPAPSPDSLTQTYLPFLLWTSWGIISHPDSV